MSQEPRYVGIDVSKATLDVGLRPTVETWSVPNDEKGIGELLRQLEELSPALVVLEVRNPGSRMISRRCASEDAEPR